MAQIEKRVGRNGVVRYRVRVRRLGQPDLSKSFADKGDAQKWARSVEREMDTQSYIPNDAAQRTTVETILTRYRDEVLIPRGAKPDISRIARLILAFGKKNLAALDAAAVAAYRDKRLKDAANQTVKHEIGLLQRVLRHCESEWSIHLPRGVVTEGVRRPALPRGRDRRLTHGEEDRLLNAAKRSRSAEIGPLIVIALETGARRGEIHRMEWRHIDLVRRTWHIPVTKTGVPRTVPLSPRAVEVLRAIPRRLDAGRVWTIAREDGISQAFRRVAHSAASYSLVYHDLRHEATSRFFERGLSIVEVAAITGHKDLRMLARYTHLKAEDLAVKLAGGSDGE